jgi:hypothetical protein
MQHSPNGQTPKPFVSREMDTRTTARAAKPERIGRGLVYSFLLSWVLSLAGCIGPVALHQAVLGYDKTVHRLESEMLLLNIARMYYHLPDHYTVTSAIAATFDYRTQAAIGAELPGFDTGR